VFQYLLCFVEKLVIISLDRGTDTCYKMTIFYLCVRKIQVDINFHLEPCLCYIQNSHK